MKRKMKRLLFIGTAAAAMAAGMSVPALAQVHIEGGDTYGTFDEAAAAAEDGAVIVLDTDETTAGLNLSKNLTVNGVEQRKLVFTDKGIALWGKSLTFKNCDVELTGIGSTPYTAEWNWMTVCASKDASMSLEDTVMRLDASGVTNSPHAIYFCSNNKLNLTNSTLEIRNYPQDALEWDGGDWGYNVNMENSKFLSDNNRSGFTGNFSVRAKNNSTIDVINSSGNGSNGSDFEFYDSTVHFDRNGSHGLSARNLTVSNTTLSASENGGNGIHITGKGLLENKSIVDVYRNECTISSKWTVPAAVRVQGTGSLTVDRTVDLTIMENKGSGIGVGSDAKAEIQTGIIKNNEAQKLEFGGGIHNMGTVNLFSRVVLYNNHAPKGADDIYNGDGAEIRFGNTSREWLLDDCDPYHVIDGWYDDTEESRWNAHGGESERHILLVNSGSKTGMLQVKAAHGLNADDKESRPDIDKKADGEDEIKGVKPGDVVSFTLESHLPARLAGFAVRSDSDAEKLYIPEKFSERMVFHDVMSGNLEFDQDTLKVTVGKDGRELPEAYYKVETGKDGETFRVSIYLIAAFNDGYITYDELKNAEPVVVSYDASVSDKAIDGDKVENRAWVNDSEIDIVDGPVIDPDVPSTGGMGTRAFTFAGIAMMGAAAGAVIVTGKRKRSGRQ